MLEMAYRRIEGIAMSKFNKLNFLSVILAIVFIASCSGKKDDENLPIEVLYSQGVEQIQAEKYRKAIDSFEEIDRNYPYSKWATRAQLMAAYSYYQDEAYDDAISALDRFIKMHPGNKDVAYAYYLKAMCYYDQIATVERDQSNTEKARDALKEVLARYPDTDYGRDAKIKIDLVNDHLAGKQVEVGRFYAQHKDYIAAINRYLIVVQDYQTTTHVEEALYRLVEAYTILGIKEEAQKYAAVLGYNYPGSKWYKYSYDLVNNKFSGVVLDKPVDKSYWWNFHSKSANKNDQSKSSKNMTTPPK